MSKKYWRDRAWAAQRGDGPPPAPPPDVVEHRYRPGDPEYLAWQARLRLLVRDPPPLDPLDRTDYEGMILDQQEREAY